MGRTSDLESAVKMLEYKFSKLQHESQQSINFLEAKIKNLEDTLDAREKDDEIKLSPEFKKDPSTTVKQILNCEKCGKIIYSARNMNRHLKDKHFVPNYKNVIN